jgi:hypothetical protein
MPGRSKFFYISGVWQSDVLFRPLKRSQQPCVETPSESAHDSDEPGVHVSSALSTLHFSETQLLHRFYLTSNGGLGQSCWPITHVIFYAQILPWIASHFPGFRPLLGDLIGAYR